MKDSDHGTEALRCRVSGRVQGVFFRASTQRQARSLGLAGHARNLDDGSVEVLAVGSPAALGELKSWLGVGPTGARVDAVDCASEPVPDPMPGGFSTR
ncbi:MAG: acylphosphatase [Thioalkalivibrio sp.]|nr:MAG: acylphosphatase [Thioalkalivibrio sp.]